MLGNGALEVDDRHLVDPICDTSQVLACAQGETHGNCLLIANSGAIIVVRFGLSPRSLSDISSKLFAG